MVNACIGKVSARGQVAIPQEIREKMDLQEGERLLFLLEGDALMVKKVSSVSWKTLIKPLHEAKKKISESQVNSLVHQSRKSKT